MKFFFKKRLLKTGYSNISEPISDLNPQRISYIKSKHVSELDPKVIAALKAQQIKSAKIQLEKDGTDATVLLTPSSSQSSKFIIKALTGKDGLISDMQSAGTPAGFTVSETVTTCSPAEVASKLSIQKQLFASRTDSSKDSVSRSSSKQLSVKSATALSQNGSEDDSVPRPPPKTPDTFFQGKNRKSIFKIDDEIKTDAPADPLYTVGADDQDDEYCDEYRVKESQLEGNTKLRSQEIGTDKEERKKIPVFDMKPSLLEKSISTSSDLDRTFSPEIISVSSDITEPSYNLHPSRKSSRTSRRTWTTMRENFQDACRQHDSKAPMSILDTILDNICPGPSR
jgi:hypothetical protein|eukprot:scaffold1451_cov239-Chaetoceros_neogracile.AAC.5